MVGYEGLPAALILAPLFFALLATVSSSHPVRKVVTYVGTLTLISLSIALWIKSPMILFIREDLYPLILAGDYLLFAYFLYQGVVFRSRLVIYLTIAQAALMTAFIKTVHVQGKAPTIVVDGLSSLMVLVTGVVGSVIVAYSIRYMETGEDLGRENRFLGVMFLFLGAMNALVFSNNMEWIFLFYEITTFASYYLIKYRGDEESIANSLQALWMNQLGGLAVLMAVIFSANFYGTLFLTELIKEKALLPIAFLVLGAMVKSAQLPFQGWLLGAMVAPTPVSALLHSSTMVKIGPYLILRISPIISGTALGGVVALAGAITFTVALTMALSQRKFKRLLAYSTIATMGGMIICGGVGTPLAIMAGVTLLAFHALSKGLLFLGAGIAEKEFGAKTIEDLLGLVKKGPITAGIITFGAVSMAFPPFGIFLGKWLVIQALVISKQYIPLAALVIGSGIGIMVYMKIVSRVLVGRGFIPGLEKLSSVYTISTGTFVAILGGLTIMYAFFVDTIVEKAVESLTHTTLLGAGIGGPGFGVVLNAGRMEPWQLVAIFTLIVLLPLAAYFYKWIGVDRVYEYTCGEPMKPSIGAYYFTDRLGEERLSKVFTPFGVALMAVILLTGVT